MSPVSMAPEAVFARLELASDLADLRPEHRLDAKLDMSPQGVMRRLQLASELRDLCNALARAGRGDADSGEGAAPRAVVEVDCPAMWDQRYAEPGYAYGTEPNDFVAEFGARIPEGPVLCVAEGQGRNAVFLAGLGHAVTAVDASPVGLQKADALAAERGVPLTTIIADLANFELGQGQWAGVVSVFVHLPPPVRVELHRRIVSALRPGGVLLLEAYTPAQIGRGTGGPPNAALMMSLEGLRAELEGLEVELGRERVREVVEGRFHTGEAAVVQLLARKPAPTG